MPILQAISPHTGQVLRKTPMANPASITEAIVAAHHAQKLWAAASLKQRAKVLRRIAKAIEANGDRLARMVTEETGKPLADAYSTDVAMAAGIFATVAREGVAAFSPQPFTLAEGWRAWTMGRTHRQEALPKGVVAVITPWNYPLGIAAWGIAASLMAGNAVILKPSELAAHCGNRLVDLIQTTIAEAKLPTAIAETLATSLVQCVLGDGPVGQALVEGDVQHVIFTGSTAVGHKLQTQLAARNIDITLELGGNCPLIALPEAVATPEAIDALAQQITWGRCVNTGQSCAAVKRVLVPKAQTDKLVTALKTHFSQLQYSFATPDGSFTPGHVGPLVSMEQRNRLHKQVIAARQQGGLVVLGGELPTGNDNPLTLGAYYPPTIITNLPDNAPILQDELFGPVLIVQPYINVEEAVRLANATPYGLTASVFGPSHDAEKVARQLHAGLVTVNDVALSHYGFLHVPWHGWKASGNSTASHGRAALQSLAHWHTVGINRLPSFPQPWLFGAKPSSSPNLGQGLLHWLTRPWWQQIFNLKLLKTLCQKDR